MNERLWTLRPLVIGVWLAALVWPYATSGALPVPLIVVLLPLCLALIGYWRQPSGRVVATAALVLAVLWRESSAVGALQVLASAAPSLRWAALAAVWQDPLVPGLVMILLATLLGWSIYREADNRDRILLLLALGTAILLGNHVFWHLAVGTALFLYVAVGLVLLAWAHLHRLLAEGPLAPPTAGWAAGLGLTIAIPLGLGAILPIAGPHPVLPAATPTGARVNAGGPAETGLSIGSANINHSVSPTDTPVLVIQDVPAPAYWQAAVYSHFNGYAWMAGTPASHPAGPGPILPAQETGFPTEVWRPLITVSDPMLASQLVYTGDPVRVTGAGPLTVVPSALEVLAPRLATYRELVRVPITNPTALNAVPFTAPPTALDADLSVPSVLSPRVRLLAERVTAGAAGPWQAALDLKAYLDGHERYTYAFQASPQRNPVDQFLFVTHAGYCDQFSTTFIMMSRLLGIPARWVVGYGPGTPGPTADTYLIRALDAHSWAEIYLAHYGWVAIDPTPGLPATAESETVPSRPPTTPSSPTPPSHRAGPPGGSGDLRKPSTRTAPTQHALDLAIGAGLILVVGAGGWALTRRRQARHRRLRAAMAPTAVLDSAWDALVGQVASSDVRSPLSLREQWALLPQDIGVPLVPVVHLLEAWWYGGAPPSGPSVDDAKARLASARLALAQRRRA